MAEESFSGCKFGLSLFSTHVDFYVAGVIVIELDLSTEVMELFGVFDCFVIKLDYETRVGCR